MKTILAQSRFLSENIGSLTRIALGITLMFITSQAQIPLEPVPVTMQTVGVLILGLCFSKKEALGSIIGFATLGAIGLPVFSGFTSGIMAPKGGYYLGFILAVYLITTMREKFGEDKYLHLVIYGIIGSIVVFTIGVPWLSYFIGFKQAVQFGLLPFILPGIVKALFTASTVKLLMNTRR